MSISALALYGSRARNDHAEGSDTDLFAITTDANYKMVVEGKLNIACYPKEQAFSRAEGGDLFFMHIVNEGTPIYDLGGDFREVKNRFKYKATYSKEIEAATNLGYALIKNQKNVNNFLFFNKRLVWCVRTMLIARTAERREPVFSAHALALKFEDRRISEVINIKSSPTYERRTYTLAQELFKNYGSTLSDDIPSNYEDLIEFFKSSKNEVGIKTAKLLAKDQDTGEYDWI